MWQARSQPGPQSLVESHFRKFIHIFQHKSLLTDAISGQVPNSSMPAIRMMWTPHQHLNTNQVITPAKILPSPHKLNLAAHRFLRTKLSSKMAFPPANSKLPSPWPDTSAIPNQVTSLSAFFNSQLIHPCFLQKFAIKLEQRGGFSPDDLPHESHILEQVNSQT